MANWVHISIQIEGEKEEIDEFIMMTSDKGEFSFGRVISFPEDVRNKPSEEDVRGVYFREYFKEDAMFHEDDVMPSYKCVQVKGHWECIICTGAIRSGYERKSDSILMLYFDHAWSFPERVYRILLAMFPKLIFSGVGVEEMGAFEVLLDGEDIRRVAGPETSIGKFRMECGDVWPVTCAGNEITFEF